MSTDPKPLDEFASLDDLKKQHRKVLRRMNKMQDEKINLEKTIAQAAHAAFSSMKLPKPANPKLKDRKDSETAVISSADWQLGKVTPDYDSEIASARIRRYFDKTAHLTNIQREEHPVNDAEIWVLGDIVEGERIFPGQEFVIDSALIEQILDVSVPLLRDQVWQALETYQNLTVRMVVGNHGRIGGTKSSVYHPNTNADRMAYRVTKMWFDAAGLGARITWAIPLSAKGDRGWYTVATIGRYSSLLIHGDQFRGGGGISGLPYPSMMKKILYWRDAALDGLLDSVDPYTESDDDRYDANSVDMPVFGDVACGHWHVGATIPVGRRYLRIAGSPESYNVWSQEFLSRTQRPSQRMMFVHPDRGHVTNEYTVWLD